MKNKFIDACLLALLILVSCGTKQDELGEYMTTQSLQWEQLPLQWNEGAFVGNGRIGMVAYVDSADNSLTLWLGRPDVTDHRKAPDKKTSMGVAGASEMFDYCRLDIGKMKLFPEAKILSGTMSLDILKGELTGVLQTDKGEIELLAYTPTELDLNIVEVKTQVPYRWKLHPGHPNSPRIQVFPYLLKSVDYPSNPQPVCVNEEHEGSSVHKLYAGGDYATYWKEEVEADGSTLFITTMNEVPQSDVSLTKAKEEVTSAIHKGTKALRESMHAWWNQYYQTGMINIPDKKMENFYHIQLYKLATCSAPDGPAMDLFGTFYKTSQWPSIWWNLNVQLTYMVTHPTNRMAQAVNYQKLVDDCFDAIMKTRGPAKAGDFAWALHNYYSYMRYAGSSWAEISEKFMPKAQSVFELYKSHLKEIDGVIHLLQTESPEYEGFRVYDNSNYNLAALRWILRTMIEISDQTGTRPAEYEQWKEIDAKLHPAPVDENGYMIASNKPVNKSHRHYSHLLSFYPLRLHDATKPEVKEILERSIDHWLTVGDGQGLAGYSYTGSASLYAYLGNGDKAYAQLDHFLNKPIAISILCANTLYVESGGVNPTIETPLSAATALTEMLLQGWGKAIRVFPAIPSTWENCSFNQLRAEGGFVVSASRKNYQTEWITVHSDAGNPCHLYLPEWENVYLAEGSNAKITNLGEGYYAVELAKGETVSLVRNPDTQVGYHQDIPQHANFYGVKKGQELKELMDWPADLEEKWRAANPEYLEHPAKN